MEIDHHRYVGKVFQSIHMKMRKVGIHIAFLNWNWSNQFMNMDSVGNIFDESCHSSWVEFIEIFGNIQGHKFWDIENLFITTQNLVRQHSEEIPFMKRVEYVSTLWTRSTLKNGQVMKCRKSIVIVYEDCVSGIDRVEQIVEKQKEDGKILLKISGWILYIKILLWWSTQKQLFFELIFYFFTGFSKLKILFEISRTSSFSRRCSIIFCKKRWWNLRLWLWESHLSHWIILESVSQKKRHADSHDGPWGCTVTKQK